MKLDNIWSQNNLSHLERAILDTCHGKATSPQGQDTLEGSSAQAENSVRFAELHNLPIGKDRTECWARGQLFLRGLGSREAQD